MRTIMKQLVRRAVASSAMRRRAGLAELERAYSVLHAVATRIGAEEQSALRAKLGACNTALQSRHRVAVRIPFQRAPNQNEASQSSCTFVAR